MKKYIASIGAIATTLSPIIMVVSCNKNNKSKEGIDSNEDVAKAAVAKVTVNTLKTDFSNKDKLASEIAETIKKNFITGIKGLTSEIKDLISITAVGDDATGNIVVTLTADGQASKKITLNGFKTTNDLNKGAAKVAVNKITIASLATDFDAKNNRASVVAHGITTDTVKETKSLDENIKSLITITANGTDATGTVSVEIKVDNEVVKTLEIKGFQTTAVANKIAAKAAVDLITAASLKTDFVVATKKASSVDGSITTDTVKETKSLDANIKSLITITATGTDAIGIISVEIKVNNEVIKTLKISGFQTTAVANKIAAKAAVDLITAASLKTDFVVATKKASSVDGSITTDTVKETKSLDANIKSLITITATGTDAIGIISVEIKVNNEVIKTLKISGFQTTAVANKIAAKAAVDLITAASLKTDFVVATKKASSVDGSITTDTVKETKSLDANIKSLITITATGTDAIGIISVEIKVDNEVIKTLKISGFQTTAVANKIAAKAAVDLITAASLKTDFVVATKKASSVDGSITTDTVKETKSLDANIKSLITITATGNDAIGIISVEIKVNNEVIKTLKISGFQTIAVANKIAAKAAVDLISKESLTTDFVAATKKATVVAPNITTDTVKETKGLDENVKSLITITATGTDATGTIRVEIKVNNEVIKTLDIKGFQTTADLQQAIEAKKNAIQTALNGKTSDMTINKVKSILKAELDDKFDTLIDALTLTTAATNGSVTVVSGSTNITIKTSTITPPIVTADLQQAIEDKKEAIQTALNGKTSDMTINKVKSILKAELDDKFDTLIDALTLTTAATNGSVTVASGSTNITIKTSTTLTIPAKTVEEFKTAIFENKDAIKTALSSIMATLTLEQLKSVLKQCLLPSFHMLIDKLSVLIFTDVLELTLDKNNNITLKVGDAEDSPKITIETPAWNDVSIDQVKKLFIDEKEKVVKLLSHYLYGGFPLQTINRYLTLFEIAVFLSPNATKISEILIYMDTNKEDINAMFSKIFLEVYKTEYPEAKNLSAKDKNGFYTLPNQASYTFILGVLVKVDNKFQSQSKKGFNAIFKERFNLNANIHPESIILKHTFPLVWKIISKFCWKKVLDKISEERYKNYSKWIDLATFKLTWNPNKIDEDSDWKISVELKSDVKN